MGASFHAGRLGEVIFFCVIVAQAAAQLTAAQQQVIHREAARSPMLSGFLENVLF